MSRQDFSEVLSDMETERQIDEMSELRRALAEREWEIERLRGALGKAALALPVLRTMLLATKQMVGATAAAEIHAGIKVALSPPTGESGKDT